MHHFEHTNNELYAEDVSVRELAREHGTPLYVYSAATLRRHFQAYDSAFDKVRHITCFSVKCNSNLSLLHLLKREGAGADIVSGGELAKALEAGIAPEKIVFSGVGKKYWEMTYALRAGILMFNVESDQEMELLSRAASDTGIPARMSLRINPDVDPGTHPYISTGLKKNKFGVAIERAPELYARAGEDPWLEPVGIDCHIGSQLTQVSPFLESLERLKELYTRLQKMGLSIDYLDLGGGLGITYEEEDPPHPGELGEALSDALADMDVTLVLEPGRVIAGNAGIMVTRTLYTKETELKQFTVVDAAMNDLIRPSYYGAYHRIAEVTPQGRKIAPRDVVGPVCETGDFLAQDRELPFIEPGELLAVFSAGGYGFAMASQYNSRPRGAEVMVDGDRARLIRERETIEEMIAPEKRLLQRGDG
ncbi:MAG: diaminopimelate decarboxylase [Desulfohalobiaceae bacterium]